MPRSHLTCRRGGGRQPCLHRPSPSSGESAPQGRACWGAGQGPQRQGTPPWAARSRLSQTASASTAAATGAALLPIPMPSRPPPTIRAISHGFPKSSQKQVYLGSIWTASTLMTTCLQESSRQRFAKSLRQRRQQHRRDGGHCASAAAPGVCQALGPIHLQPSVPSARRFWVIALL